MIVLVAVSRDKIRWLALSTITVSGVTCPPTIASPKPQVALITICSRVAINRVGCKQNAGRVSRNELLHDNRQANSGRIDPLTHPVRDSPGCPQTRPAFFHRFQQGSFPLNIEVGILLTGKTGCGQVLGGGGGTHGNRPHPRRQAWQ